MYRESTKRNTDISNLNQIQKKTLISQFDEFIIECGFRYADIQFVYLYRFVVII